MKRMMRFVSWDNSTGQLVPAQHTLSLPVDILNRSWWSSTSAAADSRANTEVTHFGDRDSAHFRAQVNQLSRRPATGLYEIHLPADLSVYEEVYLDNGANPGMAAFEEMFLGSSTDVAIYWNVAEAKEGGWSIILRREWVGELTIDNLHPAIQSKFTVASTTTGLIYPDISWAPCSERP